MFKRKTLSSVELFSESSNDAPPFIPFSLGYRMGDSIWSDLNYRSRPSSALVLGGRAHHPWYILISHVLLLGNIVSVDLSGIFLAVTQSSLILNELANVTRDLRHLGTPFEDSQESWIKVFRTREIQSHVVPVHGI
jgi:hypothetical protein